MEFIEILKVIVYGIVEGFSEWLPISSTGHLILVEQLIPLDVPDVEAFWPMFKVVIQFGAMLAIVPLYFKKLNPFDREKTEGQKNSTIRLWIKIIVGCIPAAVIGLPLDNVFGPLEDSFVLVAAMLVLYGVLFILIENHNYNKEFPIERVTQISMRTAVAIGLFQVLALIPGTSRSGATILGAMLIGCSRGAAAEFSFFLGVPVIAGASILKLIKYFMSDAVITSAHISYLLLGMVIAFVVSVYSIKFLMGYIRKHDFKFFGYYRIVLGGLILVYWAVTMMVGGGA